MAKAEGRILVGIGGWTFEPWRGTFFPEGLPHARELEHASRQVTAIEVNGTFYRSQTPATFAKWRGEVPDGFVFSLKAPRFAVNRKVLAEAGPSIDKFVESGIAELEDRLGPILWQLAPTKRFDHDDLAAFLDVLPEKAGGIALRHALEVRHESFRDPDFIALARARGVTLVYADSDDYPAIADLTGSFVYARLQRASEDEPAGYPPSVIAAWADRARLWAGGGDPADLPHAAPENAAAAAPSRDVFIFMINGAKVRAPHAARALIAQLDGAGP